MIRMLCFTRRACGCHVTSGINWIKAVVTQSGVLYVKRHRRRGRGRTETSSRASSEFNLSFIHFSFGSVPLSSCLFSHAAALSQLRAQTTAEETLIHHNGASNDTAQLLASHSIRAIFRSTLHKQIKLPL